MKHVLLTTVFFTSMMACMAQQKEFIIKGKIKGQESGMLNLSYVGAAEKQVQDSVAIKNGTSNLRVL